MGKLFIVSTPIGNLEDITIRAIRTLFSVDVILCEDTRRTGILLQELQKRFSPIIYPSSDESSRSREVHTDSSRFAPQSGTLSNNKTPTLISYFDQIEEKRTPEIIELLEQDKNIALVSDAGTPLLSDPGFLLIREAIKRNIKVVSIPGASALLTALTSSGLPAQPFLFLGFPPEKQSHRIKLFESLLNLHRPASPARLASKRAGGFKLSTYIFYCAPHKLQQTFTDMKEIFGDIDVVVARELTKIHEEIWRGKLSAALTHFQNPKGEFVILFSSQGQSF